MIGWGATVSCIEEGQMSGDVIDCVKVGKKFYCDVDAVKKLVDSGLEEIHAHIERHEKDGHYLVSGFGTENMRVHFMYANSKLVDDLIEYLGLEYKRFPERVEFVKKGEVT